MNIEKPKSDQPLPAHAKLVFKGIIFDVYQWDQQMFDGSFEIFEKLKRKDTSVVIPITKEGKIAILKEVQPSKKPAITLPGGQIDGEEDALEAAKRELLEETGLQSEKWKLWFAHQPYSRIEWAIYVFVAQNCEKIKEQKLDSGEKIDVEMVSFDEFLQIAQVDDFSDIDIKMKVLEALVTAEKMDELRMNFFEA